VDTSYTWPHSCYMHAHSCSDSYTPAHTRTLLLRLVHSCPVVLRGHVVHLATLLLHTCALLRIHWHVHSCSRTRTLLLTYRTLMLTHTYTLAHIHVDVPPLLTSTYKYALASVHVHACSHTRTCPPTDRQSRAVAATGHSTLPYVVKTAAVKTAAVKTAVVKTAVVADSRCQATAKPATRGPDGSPGGSMDKLLGVLW